MAAMIHIDRLRIFKWFDSEFLSRNICLDLQKGKSGLLKRSAEVVEKILTVRNRAGIHARPAALIAQTANKFASEIIIEKDSSTVNAKSIMGVITMAAAYNTTLTLRAEGPDEVDAAEAILNLFESKFEED